jgi:hypothetical protein
MVSSRRRPLNRQGKTITRNPLTEVVLFGYHNSLKVMLLMVAITEATTDEPADFSRNAFGPVTKTIHRVRNRVKEVNQHGR